MRKVKPRGFQKIILCLLHFFKFFCCIIFLFFVFFLHIINIWQFSSLAFNVFRHWVNMSSNIAKIKIFLSFIQNEQRFWLFGSLVLLTKCQHLVLRPFDSLTYWTPISAYSINCHHYLSTPNKSVLTLHPPLCLPVRHFVR